MAVAVLAVALILQSARDITAYERLGRLVRRVPFAIQSDPEQRNSARLGKQGILFRCPRIMRQNAHNANNFVASNDEMNGEIAGLRDNAFRFRHFCENTE